MTNTNPAVSYEKFFVPAIGAPLANELVRRAALQPGERVLDVACGTGVVTRLASEALGADGTVAGLDVNPAMLAVARSVAPSDRSIEWHEASAEKMPLEDASFDVVLCQMGLQFVPDKSAALGEMARILVPGGRLVLNLPGPTPQLMTVMEKAIAHHIGPEAAKFVELVFSLHDTTEIKKLVGEAGFNEVSVEAETVSLPLPAPKEFLWQYVESTPLVGAMANVDDKRRGLLEHDILSQWKEFEAGKGLMLSLRMVLVEAQK